LKVPVPIDHVVFNDFPVDVLRLDLIHPHYGGNKFFKLKYNLERALSNGYDQLLTFGGAHSNHIYSAAAFCKEKNLKCIGVIRGEENSISESPTLQFAMECGMQLYFVSREKYRNKETLIDELEERFGKFYLIPEGGSNKEGVKGCAEILDLVNKHYDYIFCACGTAAAFSGIKISLQPAQIAVGISVLKGENFLMDGANKWFAESGVKNISECKGGVIEDSTIINDYHFGGYAKCPEELLAFKKQFESKFNILLDYVYTSKLFFAVNDLIMKKKLKPASSVLIIHSGGQQGNAAFEKRYQVKPIL
jgi:1-aminocyclopropane-1-carboxylate deaminase